MACRAGSQTVTVVDDAPRVVTLRLAPRRVQWENGTVDNEFMNKKKSKSNIGESGCILKTFISLQFSECCIYHRPRRFDESSSSDSSSSSDDSDSETDDGAKKTSRKCHHHHHHDHDDEHEDKDGEDKKNKDDAEGTIGGASASS